MHFESSFAQPSFAQFHSGRFPLIRIVPITFLRPYSFESGDWRRRTSHFEPLAGVLQVASLPAACMSLELAEKFK